MWAPGMATEPANYTETVRILLDRGADPTVPCRMPAGDDEPQKWCTPLELANLHDVGEEINTLLQKALDIDIASSSADAGLPRKKYSHNPDMGYCDIFFSTIYGISYICTTCQNILVCQKCHGHIDIYFGQPPTAEMEEQTHHTHEFDILNTGEPEFQDSPLLNSPSSSSSFSSSSVASSPLVLPSAAESPRPLHFSGCSNTGDADEIEAIVHEDQKGTLDIDENRTT